MKRILFIGLFFILSAITCLAQSIYSKQNLELISMENLDIYLKKAHNLKTAGTIVTMAGSASILAGTGLMLSNRETATYMGIGVFLIGSCVTVIGLPILITGSSRVKRINGIKNPISDRTFIEITPCSFHDYMVQSYNPGVTLRIKF